MFKRAPLVRIIVSLLAALLAAAGAYGGIIAQISGPLARTQLAWTVLAAASSGVFAFLTTMAGGYALRALRTDQGGTDHSRPAVEAKPVWGKIPLRKPDFTDRETTLDLIRATLADPEEGADPRSCALVGLGGVGKTTIAAEFAYRSRRDYSVVWWIRADQQATIIEDLSSLATALHGDRVEGSVDVITQVRQGLMNRAPWLLIFDNAESQTDLRDCWPGGSAGSVLLTSRNAVWDELTAVTVPVDVLETADAMTLLQRRSGRVDDPSAAAEIAERLGRLPLALVQAGSYVSKTKTSLRRYGELIEGRAEAVLGAVTPDDHSASVVTTWTVSFDAANRQALGARELLAMCAFLAPSGIPRWLITAQAEMLPEPLRSVAGDPVAYDLAIAAQTQYSLLTADENWLSMHRLVQLAVRNNLSPAEQRMWTETALAVLGRAFPGDPARRSSWALCGELIPHVLAAVEHGLRHGSDSLASGQLLFRAGQYLVERGAYNEAVDTLRRAVEVLSAAVAPDSLEVGEASRLLANALLRTADLPNTVVTAERALSIHEKRLGPNDPRIVADLVELGRVYREVSRLSESRVALQRALLLAEGQPGTDHTDLATVLQQLASTVWRIGHLGKARALLERALTLTESSGGKPNAEAASIQRTLGVVFRDLRRLDPARHHLELAEALFVALDGPESVMAVRVRQVLSEVLILSGNAEPAYELITQVIERLAAVYGADHPNVGEALRTEGMALNALGRPAEAVPILMRCVGLYESTHGSDHAYVAEPLVPLAASYRLLGKASQAAEAIDRAKLIVIASYGEGHPAYATIAEELGCQQGAAGDEEAAAALAAAAVSIRRHAEGVQDDD